MPSIKSLFLILFVSCLCIGCETVLEIDVPKTPPKIVLNSFFNPDSFWNISLTNSRNILDREGFSLIDNATVSIYDNNGLVEVMNTPDPYDGNYKSNLNKPIKDASYKVIVTAPNYVTIEASDIIPDKVQIISFDTSTVTLESQNYLQIGVKFLDPINIRNYYNIQVEAYTKRYFRDMNNNIVDSIIYNEFIYFESRDLVFDRDIYIDRYGGFFSDELINGKTYDVKLLIRDNYYDSETKIQKLFIHLKSISETHYKYNITFYKHVQASGDPFSQPVQVFNNVQNGFGVFAGYNSSVDSILFK